MPQNDSKSMGILKTRIIELFGLSTFSYWKKGEKKLEKENKREKMKIEKKSENLTEVRGWEGGKEK